MAGQREKVIGDVTILGALVEKGIWIGSAYCQGDSGEEIQSFLFRGAEALLCVSLEPRLLFAALAVQEWERETS